MARFFKAFALMALLAGCAKAPAGTGAEQALAVRGPLRAWFHSRGYAQARDRACEGLRVAVDWDAYRAKIAVRGRPGK